MSSPQELDPREEAGANLQPQADLLRGLFLDEVGEQLAGLAEAQRSLARVPEGAPPVEAANALLRYLHTLKGAAGSVGIEAIARSAHEMEDLCAEIRGGRLAVTAGILERIDEGLATIRALVDGARSVPGAAGVNGNPAAAASLPRQRLHHEGDDRRRTPDRRRGLERRAVEDRTLRVDAGRLDDLLDGVGDLVILGTRIERRLQELESVLRDIQTTRGSLRETLREAGETAPVWNRAGVMHPAATPGLGPWLDRLADVELELGNAAAHVDRATRALGNEAGSLRRASADLDDQLRRARLIPLDWAFQRLPHALRELERTTGRQADLVITGGEIEVDNGLCEQMGEVLLHLLRNALAHGIESPVERIAHGKPARGRLSVSAQQEDDFIVICFDDDGRGVDRDQVRQTLRRKQESGELDEAALLAVLFEPGFSTRERADGLAGRGMGLDIVKRSVSRLGGEVGLESVPGVSTRFQLTVPVTAAITKAVLFKVGGQVYAVPAAHVLEVLPLRPDALPTSPASPGRNGRTSSRTLVPILRLQSLLGVEMPPLRRTVALHLRFGERCFIATCDKIIGPRTIVVRPLGPVLVGLGLYAGVTISGAGKAQLIFDLGALADAAFAHPHPTPAGPRRVQPRILVVDDSRLSRESAARVLVASGFQTVTAEDGWDAWELLSERRFDVVVTDLEMPRLDGFELIGRIRREPTLKELPVIVLSSRAGGRATRAQALAAGANTVLPKSTPKKTLADTVTSFLAAR